MDATPEILGELSLFEGLSPERLVVLAERCRISSVNKGEHVFRAGDPGNGLYAVVSGLVRIYRGSPGGKEQVLHFIEPGEPFGEVAVFQGDAFPADAQAMVPSQVLFMSRRDFLDLARQDPEITLQMLARLSLRLRRFVHQVAELSLKEVPARLAAYLLKELEEQGSNPLTLPMSKGQLASFLGTIQETLSRSLKRLEGQGLIVVKGREIGVLDLSALQSVAEQGR
ncbi:MAG: Crp/Fnr family transcriptional regulator [Desulfovibrio sp.]|nr:MAG: Crp/Fnr family transcriptional regulator [Desulfovibrio sp.]